MPASSASIQESSHCRAEAILIGVQRITRRHSLKRSGDMMICYVPRHFLTEACPRRPKSQSFMQLLIGASSMACYFLGISLNQSALQYTTFAETWRMPTHAAGDSDTRPSATCRDRCPYTHRRATAYTVRPTVSTLTRSHKPFSRLQKTGSHIRFRTHQAPGRRRLPREWASIGHRYRLRA